MRVYISFITLFMLAALIINAQDIFTPPLKPVTAYKDGETLTYQIKYGFIVGGITTLSLSEAVYNDKEVFHAKAIGQTTGIANAIYGVKDVYESWFDKKTTFPYKQVRNIKEGHYTTYNEVTYNRKNNTVNSQLSGIHKVPEKILDLTSTFYYLRRVDFSRMNVGDVVFVNMYFADEIFPFRLRYGGKEIIRTKFGKISCLKISPVVEVGRMFKAQDDLTIWFTDDKMRLPILVRMDISAVGSVLLKLIKCENTVSQMMVQNQSSIFDPSTNLPKSETSDLLTNKHQHIKSQ